MSKTDQTLREILEKHIGIDEKTKSLVISINDIDAEVAFNYNNKLEVKALLNGIVKEISELLVECVPERQGSAALFDRVQRAGFENLSKYSAKALGYNQAIDDYEKNIKARLQ